MKAKTIHLIPGMGVDARVFAMLQLPSNFKVAPLIPVEKPLEMSQYAAIMAQKMKFAKGDMICGFSFGGFVALEIAKKYKAGGVLLISSGKNRNCFAFWILKILPFVPWVPVGLQSIILNNLPYFLKLIGGLSTNKTSYIAGMAKSFPRQLLKHIPKMILKWKGIEPPPGTIWVRGMKDWLVTWNPSPGEIIWIPDAKHILPLSHPGRIREILLKWVRDNQEYDNHE